MRLQRGKVQDRCASGPLLLTLAQAVFSKNPRRPLPPACSQFWFWLPLLR